MKRTYANGAVISAACILLSACASTNLKQVDRTPEFHAARVRHVLVIAVARTPQQRQAIESEFVRQWKDRGVNAEASDIHFPDLNKATRSDFADFSRQQQFDSVLALHLQKRGSLNNDVPTPMNPSLSREYDAVIASPHNDIDYEMAIISTKLYDVATEKPVWSATSETLVVSGETQELVKPFVKTILKNLYKDAK
jgi:hypothetical protein